MVFDNTILIEDGNGNGIDITFEEARELYKRLSAMFEPENYVVDKSTEYVFPKFPVINPCFWEWNPDRLRWDGSPIITRCHSNPNGDTTIEYSDGTKTKVLK